MNLQGKNEEAPRSKFERKRSAPVPAVGMIDARSVLPRSTQHVSASDHQYLALLTIYISLPPDRLPTKRVNNCNEEYGREFEPGRDE